MVYSAIAPPARKKQKQYTKMARDELLQLSRGQLTMSRIFVPSLVRDWVDKG